MAIRSPAWSAASIRSSAPLRIGHARQVVQGAGTGLEEALELVIGAEAAAGQERRDREPRIR